MNESKSSRYHRAERCAGGAVLATTAVLLTVLALTGWSARLRDAVGGSLAGYVFLLVLLCQTATFPATWYRSYVLERQYELSQMAWTVWLRDYVKSAAITLTLAVAAAEFVYWTMRTWPWWWWLFAAAGGLVLSAMLTSVAPVVILPMFHRSRPLSRERLRRRLVDLSARTGTPVLEVYEWSLGEKTRRANAALVGAGTTRRILLSDTLLARYTDDEIEVVLAHELGHHVHHDVLKTLTAEFVVLAVSLSSAAVVLKAVWKPLQLAAPSDLAGLPVLLLTAGSVSLLATPLLNALSRRNERRADRFALQFASSPGAFVGAMRRMAAQNLAEERPSRTALWLFHSHPGIDERIEQASGMVAPGSCGARRQMRNMPRLPGMPGFIRHRQRGTNAGGGPRI